VLSPADHALVTRDCALPGLSVLLDDDAVCSLVGAPVRRTYLRYKPGTSCVLGATAMLPDGLADIFVTAYNAAGTVKADKLLAEAPLGSVLAFDRTAGVVAARAAADRDLPLLGVLDNERRRHRLLERVLPDRGGLRGARLSTLSYKPMRRWVGLVEPEHGTPFVVRAYRPADAAAAVAAVRALEGRGARTPRLLGTELSLGLLAVEYLPGLLLQAAKARDTDLRAAGRALAQLHSLPSSGLPARSGSDDAEAVRATARQVAELLPDVAAEVSCLAEQLARLLSSRREPSATLHGDFSADQAVVGPTGQVGLLDLDRAASGHPAIDLASFSAALMAEGVLAGGLGARPENITREVHAGYAELRPLPDDDAITVRTAALLLRRADEPFRLCVPDWPDRTRTLLCRAADLLDTRDPLARAPDDLLAALVGLPLSLETLKDKPGRRRTSRATGPAGSAIVKVYASGRAPVVAARIGALHDGPSEPVLPRVLLCDEARHLVALTEVPGRSFREALLAGDPDAATRVGRALGRWHAAYRDRVPAVLHPHSAEREVQTLLDRCSTAPQPIADVVRRVAPALSAPWPARTVVHRDLYEEQIVLADKVGLLDLDDAAAGPAELDLGNLLAHLALLSQRQPVDVGPAVVHLMQAYAEQAPVDVALLERCRALSLLRLACLHAEPLLFDDLSWPAQADERTLIGASSTAHRNGQGK